MLSAHVDLYLMTSTVYSVHGARACFNITKQLVNFIEATIAVQWLVLDFGWLMVAGEVVLKTPHFMNSVDNLSDRKKRKKTQHSSKEQDKTFCAQP